MIKVSHVIDYFTFYSVTHNYENMSNALNWKWMFSLGVVTWIVPFVVSFVIYPIHTINRPLFESVLPNVIVLTTCLSMVYFFNKVARLNTRQGVIIGLSWMGINLLFDLALFLPPSPMQMNIVDYFYDVGVTYFMIPVITTTIAFFSSHKQQ